MSLFGSARFWFAAPIVLWMAFEAGPVYPHEVQPEITGANPYRTIRNWGMLPEERPWGAANGVDIDPVCVVPPVSTSPCNDAL